MNKANILVTGGLGYIGSHTSVELINNSYNVACMTYLWFNEDEFKLAELKPFIEKWENKLKCNLHLEIHTSKDL